ncbi:MAG: response regulator [Candidatus Competibacteraceae bacterium]|jgi:two-component system OmpR family response regulator|nr:response regulator [Candidatus Competibacteraceae bacterium]
MSEVQHILVVDDDPIICELLEKYLTAEGFLVSTAQSGEAMRDIMANQAIDLAILDLIMPGEDGLTLTRYLQHEHSNVSVVILTAKSETVDRIVGLEMGADDYIVKPFDLRELLARIKSVLRRRQRATDREEKSVPPTPARNAAQVHFAGWRLDLSLYELTSPHNDKVPLTTGEFELLMAFIRHPHRVLSRDELLTIIHNREAGPYDRSIDVQVGRLRRKIEIDPSQPELVKTVRGAGYLFTPTVHTVHGDASL